MAARLHDWRSRLAAVIDDAMRKPFVWGETDCALFAADCIAAVTGEEVARDFRGSYDSRRTAGETLQRAGHTDLAALAAATFPEIHPSQARAGDIALLPGHAPFGWSLGIFAGERIGGVTPRGYGTIARPEGLRAFKVGE